MYEVFLNDRKIIVADVHEIPVLNGLAGIEQISDPVSLVNHVSRFLSLEVKAMILTGELSWLWNEFQKIFVLLPAAGGVVRSKHGILFIYRRGKWDLPKGKIDRDEAPKEAALREVTEETGLKQLRMEGSLPSTWHIYRSPYKSSKGEWILKETKWYSMTTLKDEPLVPETGEDIEEARWFPVEKLEEVMANTWSSLKGLITGL
jgi:8-oxo-dGTP pyrophosphatase MutT (NUDIX family)